MDYKKLASEIIENIGGAENVENVTHCATRLRFHLVDDSKADKEKIEHLKGVFSVVDKNGQFQVVIGNDVPNVYGEIVKLGNFSDGKESSEKKKFKITDIFDVIASIFVPLIPAIAGCGLLKGLLSLFTTFGWIDAASQTYTILNLVGDAGFYFLPVLLAFTAAKRFKTSPYLAVVLAGVLLHPNLQELFNAGEPIRFLGLPVTVARYASSVIPIILIVWILSYVNRFFEKYVPKAIRVVISPLCTLLVMTPLALVVLGPIGTIVGDYIAKGIIFLDGKASWLIPTIIGGTTPLLVMSGMHYSLFPGVFQQLSSVGFQTITPGMLPSNLSQAAASFGVAVKAKNKELKELATSCGITALLGITEPALYGVTLKLKRPLYAVLIGGAVGGFIMGITGVRSYTPNGASLLQIGVYIGGDGLGNVVRALLSVAVAMVVTFVLTIIFGFDEEEESTAMPVETKKANKSGKTTIYSPVDGKLVDLKEVNDETFSSEVMGKGIAVIPENGKVVAPFDGTVSALFATKHAIGLVSDQGVEVLIHIGIDTVELNGEGFQAFVKQGDHVKKGDALIEFDLNMIQEKGYDPTVMIIVTNSSNYFEIVPATEPEISSSEKILTVI